MLNINNLNKYYNKKHILNDITFSIKPGEIVGLIGENGSGKSTLMKCIMKLITIDSGSIILENNNSMKREEFLSKVSSFIETPSFYENLTGKEHINFIKSFSNNIIDLKFIYKFLNLNDYLNLKTSSYSLGMKQRLAISLAFMSCKNGIILDEPTNGLDQQSLNDLNNLIRLLKENNIWAIISSHDLSNLEDICDKFIFISSGKIIDIKYKSDICTTKYKLITNNINYTKEILSKFNYIKNIELLDDSIILDIDEKYLSDIILLLSKNSLQIIEFKSINSKLKNHYLSIMEDI